MSLGRLWSKAVKTAFAGLAMRKLNWHHLLLVSVLFVFVFVYWKMAGDGALEKIGGVFLRKTSTSCPKKPYVANVSLSDLVSTFRYKHPHDSRIVAKNEFRLGERAMKTATQLIDDLVLEYNRRPIEMECVSRLPTLVLVTAVSSNHFNELLEHITPGDKIRPHKKIVVYDLGLNQQEIDQLTKMSYVDYRKFKFSRFPDHVKNLRTYAFKPLIIAETLAQFGAVMWMDSSVILKQHSKYAHLLEWMIKRKSAFLYYVSPSRHSIVFATHERMLDYLPMRGAKESNAKMQQATGMILFNTEHVLKHVMKWVVFCSLLEDCITPKGSQLECNFHLPDDVFGGCHRYDQSLFAVLVSNAYKDEMRRYCLSRDSAGMYPAIVQRAEEKSV